MVSKRKLAFCNVGTREASKEDWEQIYVDRGKEPIEALEALLHPSIIVGRRYRSRLWNIWRVNNL